MNYPISYFELSPRNPGLTAPLGSREGSPSRRRGYKEEGDALPFDYTKMFHVIRNA